MSRPVPTRMALDDDEFIVEPRLAGSREGITYDGRRVQVSPAFSALLSGARSADERRMLLRSLKVLDGLARAASESRA